MTDAGDEHKEPTDLSSVDSLISSWTSLYESERLFSFKSLSRSDAEELFLKLAPANQAELFTQIPESERRSWIRLLAPDDAADLVQKLPEFERARALELLDDTSRREVLALLTYAEDIAGGLMNSRFVRLRPEMGVDEAIAYLRAQARSQAETIYYAYVFDPANRLVGVVSFRQLFSSPSGKLVRDIMITKVITVPDDMDREEVGSLFAAQDLLALPVVDKSGHMKGIVTFDDLVDVVQKEATEDIQKLGGTEALEAPYLTIALPQMIKKRAGWLLALFIGEMFTATAMGIYEKEISRAVVLALFIPLIISSGGNSGSQATSLIIRAMALGEVRLADWWRVLVRELSSGLALGTILGSVGLLRILLWPQRATIYGEHFVLVGITVAFSLLGIVLWGTIVGSMLPFLLRRLRFDPASASAPFVATLVDVTGLIIYFTVASLVLRGTLL